jgi:hypothetical protein
MHRAAGGCVVVVGVADSPSPRANICSVCAPVAIFARCGRVNSCCRFHSRWRGRIDHIGCFRSSRESRHVVDPLHLDRVDPEEKSEGGHRNEKPDF